MGVYREEVWSGDVDPAQYEVGPDLPLIAVGSSVYSMSKSRASSKLHTLALALVLHTQSLTGKGTVLAFGKQYPHAAARKTEPNYRLAIFTRYSELYMYMTVCT